MSDKKNLDLVGEILFEETISIGKVCVCVCVCVTNPKAQKLWLGSIS